MTDIYAEFGVTGAVISEPSTGYNEEMVSKPISVRDGDDAINTNGTNGELDHSPEVEEEASSEDQSEEQGEEGSEQTGEDTGDEGSEGAEFEAVGDVPNELTEVSNRIAESESAFSDMVADAAARGLAQESFAAITAEYDAEGSLSPASYEALAKVGYSKPFIDSFIAGQEAIGAQYMSHITAYAGGEAKFQALFAHLQATSPESADALENAIGTRDLQAIKGIINLAAGSAKKTFGVPEARSLTNRAKPVKPQSNKQVGFETKSDMVKAMTDKRYGRDAQYTREVEQKVMFAKF